MNDRTECMRQLVDMALQSGRKRLNSQTGYIHHYYQMQDEEAHVTIPVAENFLFALALLKSRTIENINEAKALLERLLHFQNFDKNDASKGNFPIYLHEYPRCNDRFTAVNVAMAVFWILKLFHQVLGSELKSHLENSFSQLLEHLLKTHTEKQAPYFIAIKIGALCQAGGGFLQQTDLQEKGKSILDDLLAHPDKMAWCCPSAIGSILSALALLHTRLSDSPWSTFWKHLEDTWHSDLSSYIGPSCKEWQQGEEPQVTLYDLFLGYFEGEFSARALKDSIVHLEAVLIPIMEDRINTSTDIQKFESKLNGVWHIYKDKKLAYCFIENYSDPNPALAKGFHPLRLLWGDRQRLHSFVCQGGNSRNVNFIELPDGIDIIFELGDLKEFDDREKSREVLFFVDTHEGVEMETSGHKATTFLLEEELRIKSGACELSMNFQLQEGEGRFLGHRMIGNRPSQIDLKGKKRYDAYDWQIFLRTIERSERCVIKVSLRFKAIG